MSTREKVIIGLMLVAVAIGGFNLLSSGKGKLKELAPTAVKEEMAAMKKFVEETTTSLTKETSSPVDAPYIISRAQSNWRGDPFLDRNSTVTYETEKVKAEAPEISPKELGLKYTGYLQVGDKNLAVVNGQEYEVGDKLEREGGYVVRAVTPTQVVIGREGSTTRVIIPLEETEF